MISEVSEDELKQCEDLLMNARAEAERRGFSPISYRIALKLANHYDDLAAKDNTTPETVQEIDAYVNIALSRRGITR